MVAVATVGILEIRELELVVLVVVVVCVVVVMMAVVVNCFPARFPSAGDSAGGCLLVTVEVAVVELPDPVVAGDTGTSSTGGGGAGDAVADLGDVAVASASTIVAAVVVTR